MIELSDEVYCELQKEASAAGTTPTEWIAAQVEAARQTGGGTAVPGRSMADALGDYIGAVSSGHTDLSERVGELFADALVEKKRAGRL